MNLIFAVALIILLHTGVAGARVTMSLFALHLGASPFTIGVLMALLALLPMMIAFEVAASCTSDSVMPPTPEDILLLREIRDSLKK